MAISKAFDEDYDDTSDAESVEVTIFVVES